MGLFQPLFSQIPGYAITDFQIGLWVALIIQLWLKWLSKILVAGMYYKSQQPKKIFDEVPTLQFSNFYKFPSF